MSLSTDSSPLVDFFDEPRLVRNEVKCEDLFDQIFHPDNDENDKLEVKKPKLTYGRKVFQAINTTTDNGFKSNDNDIHCGNELKKDLFDSPENKSITKELKSKNCKRKGKKTKKNSNSKAVKKKVTTNIDENKKENKSKSLKDELLEAYRLAIKHREVPDLEDIEKHELNIVVDKEVKTKPKKKNEPKKRGRTVKKGGNEAKPIEMNTIIESSQTLDGNRLNRIDDTDENWFHDFNQTALLSNKKKKVMCSTPCQRTRSRRSALRQTTNSNFTFSLEETRPI